MRNTHFERYRLILMPLSPIHTGSGETIEPYEYVLERQGENAFLHAINLPELLAHLSPDERRELDPMLERGYFPGLRSWLRSKARNHYRFSVLVQDGAFNELQENQDNPKRLGQIDLMTRHPDTGNPFIPGSSIKGAVRTAIVDRAACTGDQRKLEGISKKKNSALFEAHALGHIDIDHRSQREKMNLYRDPLRQIAFSDCALPDDGTYIDRVQIVKQLHSKDRLGSADPDKIQIHRDVTWSMLDGESNPAVGECRIYHQLCEKKGRDNRYAVSRNFTMQDVISACNDYYREEVEIQLDEFTERNRENDETVRQPLLTETRNLQENECIIRLGRHSHFECVVMSKPFNLSPDKGYGSTRTYVDGRFPLGWAKLRFEPWS